MNGRWSYAEVVDSGRSNSRYSWPYRSPPPAVFRYFELLTFADRLNDSDMNSTKARTRVDI